MSKASTAFLFALIFPFISLCSNYKVVLINKDSIRQSQMWELGLQEAVVLESLGNKKIGLAHWSPEMKEDQPFFFEPSEVDFVFSCHAEILPTNIKEKHLFPNSVGVNFQGRVGQVVLFSQGI